MAEKSEKYFRDYLSNVTDDQLIQFYEGLEWTPFPVLVLKEYQRRFKSKNKNEVLQKLKAHSKLAQKKTRKLTSIAKKKSLKTTKKIKTKSKKISKSIDRAIALSAEKNLHILEKLGELNKKGIITNKEFNEKKKELLKRI